MGNEIIVGKRASKTLDYVLENIQDLDEQAMFIKVSANNMRKEGSEIDASVLEEIVKTYEEDLEEGQKYAVIALGQLQYSNRLREACQSLLALCEESAGQPPLAEALRILADLTDAALAAYKVVRLDDDGING